MRVSFMILPVVVIGGALAASADSIKVGDKVYEGVYVSEGANCYYVSIPEDGTVLNAPKSEVDAKNVSVTQDREVRKELYSRWLEKRRELRGEQPSEDMDQTTTTEETAPAAVSSPAGKDEKKPGLKIVSGTGPSAGGSYDYTSAAYAATQRYSEDQKFRREAQLESRRRQREGEKIRALTQRRVFTSQDSGGSGANLGGGGGGGGSGMGGYGGSGSYGGSGGYGGGRGRR
jgi:hypothetical protein